MSLKVSARVKGVYNKDRISTPITITKNGVYDAGKNVGYSPVEVNVELKRASLLATEDGVYSANEASGYVYTLKDKLDIEEIKKLIDEIDCWYDGYSIACKTEENPFMGYYSLDTFSYYFDDLEITTISAYIDDDDEEAFCYEYLYDELLERLEIEGEEGWYIVRWDEETETTVYTPSTPPKLPRIDVIDDFRSIWAELSALLFKNIEWEEIDGLKKVQVAVYQLLDYLISNKSGVYLFRNWKGDYFPSEIFEFLDERYITETTAMFEQCRQITTVPLFNTRYVTSMSWMFRDCDNLCKVPSFDVRNVRYFTIIFSNCEKLEECYFRNIKSSLQVGSGTSYGHLLTVDSLIHLIYELRDTGATKTFTVGSANLEKLANVYVRLVDITDEMRAEDDLIDEKLPFEVCESTDEGACSIEDYALAKNWEIN